MPNQFTLAMLQMRVAPGDPDANLHHAAELIADAAAQGAQVAVLPEAMNLGWTHPSARTQAEEIPHGPTCAGLASLAWEHGLFICAGLVERAGEQVFNAAVLLGPDGRLRLLHRKINELDIAHDCYALGDRLGVAETPWGRMGVMICADGFARGQVISRTLAAMGARIILSPCAWAVPAGHDSATQPYGQLWLDNYGLVARECGLWIAGVSNVGSIPVGPWAGRECIGNSLLLGPDGQAALTGPYGEEEEAILLHRITLEPSPRPWFEP